MAIFNDNLRPEILMRAVCHILGQTDNLIYRESTGDYQFGYSGWTALILPSGNITLNHPKCNGSELATVETAVNIILWRK